MATFAQIQDERHEAKEGCRARLIVMKFAIGRTALLLFVASALTITAAACGSAKDTSGDPLVVGGMAETVTMQDNQFRPGNLQVPAGASITFLNNDGALHDAKANQGAFETDDLNKDDSDIVILSEPGEYRYYCEFHPAMKAKITVAAP